MGWTPKYSEHEVRQAVTGARSIAETLRVLGLRAAGGNHKTVKRLIAYYEIATDHFDPHWAQRRPRSNRATPLEEVLVEHSSYHRGHLKQRLYDAGLKQRRCELCGQEELWYGRPMSLILDHINGVANDHRLENLRIVCPNCAATLDTHCGRNQPIDFVSRTCAYCGGRFRPRHPAHRYCSRECGIHSKGPRKPRPETRKVPRPSYEQLKADVAAMSFLAIGRKYGVSDNAVRKWLRWYEYEQQQAEQRRIEAHPDAEAA